MAIALPQVVVEGVSYYLDKRLGELRQVTSPHKVIPIEDYYDWLWETQEGGGHEQEGD